MAKKTSKDKTTDKESSAAAEAAGGDADRPAPEQAQSTAANEQPIDGVNSQKLFDQINAASGPQISYIEQHSELVDRIAEQLTSKEAMEEAIKAALKVSGDKELIGLCMGFLNDEYKVLKFVKYR